VKTIFLAAALCATGAFAATAPSTTTIAQGGDPGSYSLTATVTGVGGTAPSGTITFLDNDNPDNPLLTTAALVPSVTALGPAVIQPMTFASPQALAAGDFKGDGILDLAIGSSSSNSLTIFLGKGDGTFTTGETLPLAAPPLFIAAGRFGRRGFVDLAVADGLAVNIFSGNGDGSFAQGQSLALPGQASSLAVGSFGGTGSDLAVTSSGSISVLIGNGDETFQAAVQTPIAGHPAGIVAMSFGAVVVDSAGSTLTPLLNAGGGAFTVKPSIATGNGSASIAAGDFDGDGIADVAVANNLDGTLMIFGGNGSGAFSLSSTIAVGAAPLGLVSADFNNDGHADLAVGSATDGDVMILLGNGTGGFTLSTLTAGTNAVLLLAGDFDNEGHVDLAVAGPASSNAVNILLTQTQRSSIATASPIAPTGLGVHQVVASYGGDAVYAPSVSASTGLTTTPTVTFTPSQAGLTVATLGDSVSETILISSAGNFDGSVALACNVTFTGAGAAVLPGCVVDPTLTVAPGAPATMTLAITSAAASAKPAQGPRAGFALLLLLGLVPKLRRKTGMLLLLVIAMASSSACNSDATDISSQGTTDGTYRIDITATAAPTGTDAGFVATTSVALTVTGQ
jgi:FG-GAP-like repeat